MLFVSRIDHAEYVAPLSPKKSLRREKCDRKNWENWLISILSIVIGYATRNGNLNLNG